MDLFGRFKKLDSSLQRGLDNGFARVFGGEVVPTEVDESLKQQAEDSVMVDSNGQRLAPCFFRVAVSSHDFNSLISGRPTLQEDLADRLGRFIRNQGWTVNDSVVVRLEPHSDLHTGQLRAYSRFEHPKGPPHALSHSTAQSSNPSAEPAVPASVPPASTPTPTESSYDSAFEDSNPGGEDAAFTGQQQAIDASVAAAASKDAASGAASGSPNASLANLIRPADASPTHRTGPQQDSGVSSQQAPQSSQIPEAYEDPYVTSEGVPSYPGTEVIAQSTPDRPVVGADGTSGAAGVESPNLTVSLLVRDGSGRSYVLKQGSNVIGRGNNMSLRIADSGVSRTHAEIAWDGFDAVLTDLQSTNGTSVNDIAIENWLLADGDIITVGHTEIEVKFDSRA